MTMECLTYSTSLTLIFIVFSKLVFSPISLSERFVFPESSYNTQFHKVNGPENEMTHDEEDVSLESPLKEQAM